MNCFAHAPLRFLVQSLHMLRGIFFLTHDHCTSHMSDMQVPSIEVFAVSMQLVDPAVVV